MAVGIRVYFSCWPYACVCVYAPLLQQQQSNSLLINVLFSNIDCFKVNKQQKATKNPLYLSLKVDVPGSLIFTPVSASAVN